METIRLIEEKDYEKVVEMIDRSVTYSNFAKFYPECSIEYIKNMLNFEEIKRRAKVTHFYIIELEQIIIACGAIGAYWDSKTESCLFNIFVDPDYQGKGYGRKIVETLENDDYFKNAERIEVPASMSAIPFYRKMGYEHKNKELIYDDGHICLEKFNKKAGEK